MTTAPHNKPVRKAVIAAAGFGTRFLPQTKAMPKEMLPLVDKPIIQYVAEEMIEAGIEDIIIVTGYAKRAIEDHFDNPSKDLVQNLTSAGKHDLLAETEAIANMANFVYVRQKGPYGNATPLLSVEHLVDDEPFIFAWGDDFVKGKTNRFSELIAVYQETGGMALTCVEADGPQDYKRYGYIGGEEIRPGVIDVKSIIEKPGSAEASPSKFATVSSYLMTPSLFDYLHSARSDLEQDEEFIFQLVLQQMINEGHSVFGVVMPDSKFYDTGNKLEYLKTVVDFALMHKGLGDDFKEYLRGKIT